MEKFPPATNLSKVFLALNPNGDPPNFIDAPSLESAVLGVGTSLMLTSIIFVTLRLYTNIKHVGKLGIDDYLCIFALLGGIGYWAIIYSLAREGASRHTWDVPASIITKSFIKRQLAMQMVVGHTTWAAKAAIAALYIRIFGSKRWIRLSSYGLIIFMFLVYSSNVVIGAVYCLPRHGAPWDGNVFASCASHVKSAIIFGVFGVVADLILLFLPFPIVLKLHLTTRKKLGLSIVFSAGFLMVVTSVASLAYRVKAYLGNDPIWNGISLIITIYAEIFGTVTISCAPSISSFWHNIFVKTSLYSSLRTGLFPRRSRSITEPESDSSPFKLGLGHNHSYSNKSENGPTRIYSSVGGSPHEECDHKL